MPLVINSNISSLNSQRQLVKSGMEMDQAMERLASGRKINTAADDAAGLAISNRQTSQIQGLDRAIANANDGISLIQTAEGALSETTNILQRMRELSIQSANGIYSNDDRTTLDAEVQQLKSELDRIAETTSFNGQNILDGSLGNVALQVGANANQTIDVDIAAFDTASLGSGTGGDIVGTNVNLGNFSLITAGSIEVNGQDIGGFSTNVLDDTNLSTGTLGSVLEDINANVSGVTVDAFVEFSASNSGTGILRGTDTLTLEVTLQDGTLQTYNITDTGSVQELADAITSTSGGVVQGSVDSDGRLQITSDVAAQIDANSTTSAVKTATGLGTTGALSTKTAQLSFTSDDGGAITIEHVGATSAGSVTDMATIGLDERKTGGDIIGAAEATTTVALAEGDVLINGISIGAGSDLGTAAKVAAINAVSDQTGVVASLTTGVSGAATDNIKLDSVSGQEISIDYQNGKSSTLLGIQETNNAASSGQTVSNIDITTAAGAQSAIDVIDGALETINSTRADLGAVNNRLDFTTANLANISENTSAARSRIVDADFAAETANLSRAQVLQQAASAMLAQANAQPQQVLSLLR